MDDQQRVLPLECGQDRLSEEAVIDNEPFTQVGRFDLTAVQQISYSLRHGSCCASTLALKNLFWDLARVIRCHRRSVMFAFGVCHRRKKERHSGGVECSTGVPQPDPMQKDRLSSLIIIWFRTAFHRVGSAGQARQNAEVLQEVPV